MHGHVIAHGKHVAGGVEERTGVIATLLDVGREGGAAQRGAHLFGDRVKEMLEDLELDGVGGHVGECNSEGVAATFCAIDLERKSPNCKPRKRFFKYFR